MQINEDSLPLRILIDLTRKCNLNCYYCHASAGIDYAGPELTPQEVIELFKAAEKLKVFDVTLTGGEPLLWNGLKEVLKASHLLRYPSLQIITNATFLTPEIRKAIKTSNLQRICVSLDGLKKVNDRNRGKGSFRKVIKNLKLLREDFENICVISVIDKNNFQNWPKLTKKLIKMGIKRQDLTPVCFSGRAQKRFTGLSYHQLKMVRQKVDKLSRELPGDFELRFNDILLSKPAKGPLSLSSYLEKNKGWQMVVRPNGDVLYSVAYWGRFWRRNEKLGDIKIGPIDNIWNRTKKYRIRLIKEAYSQSGEVKQKFKLKKIEASKKTFDEYIANFHKPNKNYLKLITSEYSLNPKNHRIRDEWFGGFLFNRINFKIFELNHSEMKSLKK